ncbi:MAG: DUF3488 and transglutaminase-like domain-containing protein [Nocardioides sp.]|nr:DUF3488 and transglutaminase-like domain-containing protein [Nocardioides sp.]
MTRDRPGPLDDLGTALVGAATVWCALLGWRPFLADPDDFLLPLAGGLLLLALTGSALRALRVPAGVVPLGQVLVLLTGATATWVPTLALGGWVPTVESVVALADKVGLGVAAAQEYAAPVPAEVRELAVLLVVAGLAAGLLVDLFACTWRLAPLAGLPLLLTYTVPAGLIGAAVPWWVFSLGAIGFLLLLARQESRRIRLWGRVVPEGGRSTAREVAGTLTGGHLGATSRRVGLLATAVALAVPLAVPVFEDGLPGGFAGRGGTGKTVEISNPMVDLRRDLTRGDDIDLVRVTTTQRDPAYLRISVLDEYDGEAWRPGERDIPAEQQASGLLPRPPGMSAALEGVERLMTISTSPNFRSVWLPTPYPASAVEVEGDWRYDVDTLDVVSADEEQPTANLDYRTRTLDLRRRADELRDAPAPRRSVADEYLDLPGELPDAVSGYAREAVGDAETDWDRAVRLQDWFQDTSRFTYTLDRPEGNGAGDLATFLSPGPEGRRGYCEQFAAAMAVMARSLGIPARVAVGFLRPEQVAPRQHMYSANDMHAWPELYFEGHGWVLLEPTPASHTQRVPAYTRDAGGPGSDPATPQPEQEDRGEPVESAPTTTPDLAPDQDTEGAAGDGGGASWWLLLALLVPAAVVAPRALRVGVSRRRWATATASDDPAAEAEAAWAELRDVVVDAGLGWDDGRSPRATGRRLHAFLLAPDRDPRDVRHPEGAAGAERALAALDRVVRAIEEARFSAGTAGASSSLHPDVSMVGTAVLAEVGPRDRRRAEWLPRSLARRPAAVVREHDSDDLTPV